MESTNFGIIAVTKENVISSWINFEAGALSREISKSFVAPFLFDLRAADVQGPLAQFQHTANTKDEILKLVSDINSRQGDGQLSKEALAAAFGAWWPSLEAQLEKLAKEAASTGPAPPKPDPDAMLAELLETTRVMQRESRSRSESDRAELDEALLIQRAVLDGMGETLSTVLRKVEILAAEKPWARLDQLSNLRALLGGSPNVINTAAERAQEPKKDNYGEGRYGEGGYGSGPVSEKT